MSMITNTELAYHQMRAKGDQEELNRQVIAWIEELEFLRSNVERMDDIVMTIIEWGMDCKLYASEAREMCHRLVQENAKLRAMLDDAGVKKDAEA